MDRNFTRRRRRRPSSSTKEHPRSASLERLEQSGKAARLGPKIERWFRERDAEMPESLVESGRRSAVEFEQRGVEPDPVLWSEKLDAFKRKHGTEASYLRIIEELEAGRPVVTCCEVMLDTDRPCPVRDVLQPLIGEAAMLEHHKIVKLELADLEED